MDFLTDFVESVQDFRAVGDPSDIVHSVYHISLQKYGPIDIRYCITIFAQSICVTISLRAGLNDQENKAFS